MLHAAKTIIAVVFLLALSVPAFANTVTTERTETTLISEVKTIQAGKKFRVALHIHLNPGWHTYWKNPGDSGVPPQFKWTLPNGFKASDIEYLAPNREQTGTLVDYAYDDDAYYLVTMTPPPILRDGMTSILALKAGWLVCKDICIPESGDFSLAFPSGAKAESGEDTPLMSKIIAKLPGKVTGSIALSVSEGQIRLDMLSDKAASAKDPVKSIVFFPENDGLIDNAAEQKLTRDPMGYTLMLKMATGVKMPDHLDGILSVFFKNGSRKDYAYHSAEAGSVAPLHGKGIPEWMDIAAAVAYALLGGLILNGMPCVFPVLSLKALAVAKKASAHPSQARKQGLAYATGVIASFLLLALALILFQKSGQVVGWGYQMQSPVFVSLLALLLFTVGLNLAGYFDLPVLLGGVGGEATRSDSAWGSFLTGILAVMVATPCTAPFMAGAIGFALTQSAAVIVAVFAALGLGLASPFLLISFYPRLIRALPKPGAWMNTFKEFLAFPMFGWTVWLLWVLAREAGGGATCVVLLGMILIAFALWLWRFKSTKLGVLALIMGAAGISSAVVVGHAPQAPMPMPDQAMAFSTTRLQSLRDQGKAVFVDATADWCLICKVNESVALSSPAVMQAFKAHQVAYLIADWTHGDSDITQYLASFGRSGVPIYVYYPPENGAPVVLPQVLTPSTVIGVLK